MTNRMRHPFRVPRVEKPRAEGRFYLPTGRRLGFAEFGDPSGALVLWFHGTPGGRRQFPLLGRRAAEKLGLRVVVVGRPGTGLSDSHPYEAMADWATDVAHVADALGAERLGVVGLSGGGPYALACAAVPPLSGQVAAVAVLGGVVPSVGPDAIATGAIELARRFAPVLSVLRRPLAEAVYAVLQPVIPLAHYACQAYASTTPEGDRRVLRRSRNGRDVHRRPRPARQGPLPGLRRRLELIRHIRDGWNILSPELGEYIEVIPPMKRVERGLVPGHGRRGLPEFPEHPGRIARAHPDPRPAITSTR